MRKNLIPWKNMHGLNTFSPNKVLGELQNQFNNFLNGNFEESEFMSQFNNKGYTFNPKFDVVETNKSYEVKAELPGLSEKDVEVTVDNNVLTVKGEKKTEKKEEKHNYYVSERTFGKFERSFVLSKDVDLGDIKAKFKHGELTISIPKKEADNHTAKKITVNG